MEEYIKLASGAQSDSDFDRAERLLASAEGVMPGAPAVALARQSLEEDKRRSGTGKSAPILNVKTADSLTIVSWGGSYSASQRKAYYEPFMAETRKTVLEDEWGGDIAMIRAMVQTGKYTAHLIDAVPDVALAGCAEGILQSIDLKQLGLSQSDFLPGAVLPCGIGTIAWSTVFAYRKDLFGSNPPRNWADFWHVRRFPGKRGMSKNAPAFTLEFALIADGVPASDVYRVLASGRGVDRAFAKLDELKPHIIWWETGAQAPQLLVDREVSMSTGWNGRFYNAIVDGNASIQIVWDGQGLDYGFWVIPYGHPEVNVALPILALRFTARSNK